jgi:hypothetical protein
MLLPFSFLQTSRARYQVTKADAANHRASGVAQANETVNLDTHMVKFRDVVVKDIILLLGSQIFGLFRQYLL